MLMISQPLVEISSCILPCCAAKFKLAAGDFAVNIQLTSGILHCMSITASKRPTGTVHYDMRDNINSLTVLFIASSWEDWPSNDLCKPLSKGWECGG